MTEELQLGDGTEAKVREFWTGFGLAVLTLGFYEVWWYYFLNDELRSIGRVLNDPKLARTVPGLSVTALVFGLLALVPDDLAWPFVAAAVVASLASLISQHRFGGRIRRAEELLGIPQGQRFGRLAILLLFPGGLLVIPYFLWFANVTRHQNALVELAAGLPRAPQTAVA